MMLPAGPMIDIKGWLEREEFGGNPFRFVSLDQISPAISKGVSLVIIIAGLLFLAWFIWGAIEWLTSGGEPESVKRARARLTNAGIGLGLILAAWAVFMIVNTLFGIPFWQEEVDLPGPYVSPCASYPYDCCRMMSQTECCKTPENILGPQCTFNPQDCIEQFSCKMPKN